jgi:signal transduction histidine kinase
VSLRSRLFSLSLAILVPAVLAAVLGIARVYQKQSEASEQNLREITRALAAVVEREFAQHEATLKTLAQTPPLARGDLKAFYDFAAAVAPTFERTITLNDLGQQMLVNTRLPFNAPLPVSRSFLELRARAGPQATLVSDLYFAPIGKEYSYGIQVPVLREGKVSYYLGMGNFARSLQKLLDDQRLRPGWNAAIVDRQGNVVARRINPEQFVGKPVTPDLMAKLGSGMREDVFETVRLDRVRSVTAYTEIPGSGWTFVVSMPKSEINQGLIDALGWTVFATILLFGLALSLASYVGRSIAGPLNQLVQVAGALGRGERVEPVQTGLRETTLVASELARASEEIRAANEDLHRRIEQAVAETRQAQEALLQSQKIEALGRLTGGIAHDFNNLLQTLSASLELGLRLAADPRSKAAMESGKRAVQRASKLTRQLMTFGRQQVSERVTFDLRNQLVTLHELIGGALRADIQLQFDLADDLWTVTADIVQLELALLNASLNARDAMPKGGTLRISAVNRKLDEGNSAGLGAGEFVCVSISDSGTGIPPENLPRIFEPFFTTKEIGKGSGLGLAQIYGFAKQSGGIARVESSLGKGTTLFLYLPRGEDEVDEPAQTRPAAASLPNQPRTVLFVEDDALVHDVVVPALQLAGFTVIPAHDAFSALQALRIAPRIDVVFSDIVMPGGRSGVDLAEDIRQVRPDMPIVLATGYSEAAATSTSLRILMKPYGIEELKAALCEEIDSRRAS